MQKKMGIGKHGTYSIGMNGEEIGIDPVGIDDGEEVEMVGKE